MTSIVLAQNKERLCAVVNAIMNLRVLDHRRTCQFLKKDPAPWN